METKNKKQAVRKGNKKSLLTLAVRRVVKDRMLLNDFAEMAELYATPLSC